jgi:hypothetical protein
VALTVFQDLSERNILVNYFGDSTWPSQDDDLRDVFLSNDKALYAIFDYNLSSIFPPGTSPRERRLPFEMSFIGLAMNRPYDTAQGEFDYDPFAWDVGCLGIQLRNRFQVCFLVFMGKMETDMTVLADSDGNGSILGSVVRQDDGARRSQKVHCRAGFGLLRRACSLSLPDDQGGQAGVAAMRRRERLLGGPSFSARREVGPSPGTTPVSRNALLASHLRALLPSRTCHTRGAPYALVRVQSVETPPFPRMILLFAYTNRAHGENNNSLRNPSNLSACQKAVVNGRRDRVRECTSGHDRHRIDNGIPSSPWASHLHVDLARMLAAEACRTGREANEGHRS